MAGVAQLNCLMESANASPQCCRSTNRSTNERASLRDWPLFNG
jgi:hypothetical protein